MANPVQHLVRANGGRWTGPFTEKMKNRVVEDLTDAGEANIETMEYPYTTIQPDADEFPVQTFVTEKKA